MSKLRGSEVWNLEDGLRLCRALQPETRKFGYHLALGGGVLNQGVSYKDIDLYLLPLDNGTKMDEPGMIAFLTDLWGEGKDLFATYSRDESLTPEPEPDEGGRLPRFVAARPGRADDGPAPEAHNLVPGQRVGDRLQFINGRGVPQWANINRRHGRWEWEEERNPDSSYSKKLKFMRHGTTRIDVFIMR